MGLHIIMRLMRLYLFAAFAGTTEKPIEIGSADDCTCFKIVTQCLHFCTIVQNCKHLKSG